MRTIQLLSTAFNMNNKKTGKDVIQQAKELHLYQKSSLDQENEDNQS